MGDLRNNRVNKGDEKYRPIDEYVGFSQFLDVLQHFSTPALYRKKTAPSTANRQKASKLEASERQAIRQCNICRSECSCRKYERDEKEQASESENDDEKNPGFSTCIFVHPHPGSHCSDSSNCQCTALTRNSSKVRPGKSNCIRPAGNKRTGRCRKGLRHQTYRRSNRVISAVLN